MYISSAMLLQSLPILLVTTYNHNQRHVQCHMQLLTALSAAFLHVLSCTLLHRGVLAMISRRPTHQRHCRGCARLASSDGCLKHHLRMCQCGEWCEVWVY